MNLPDIKKFDYLPLGHGNTDVPKLFDRLSSYPLRRWGIYLLLLVVIVSGFTL